MEARANTATDAPANATTSVATGGEILVKPLLRGASHAVAFFVAVAATFALVLQARAASDTKALAALIFGTTLATLFGTSALYHRVNWSAAARRIMRRCDHAAIFLLIAGGYTPLFLLVPEKDGGHFALAFTWIVAGVGMAKSLLWAHAPKWLTALLCVGLGWASCGQVISRASVIGGKGVGLLVASGAIYSLGALVYALKRPNPWPKIFGYHEIFHAFVVIASVTLFMHVQVVLAST